jgi:GH24 family phage-related lysozyme (muramidase)
MANISPGQIYQMITGVGDAFEGSFKESRQRGFDDAAEEAALRWQTKQSGGSKGPSQPLTLGGLESPDVVKPSYNPQGKMPTFAVADGDASPAGLLRKFEGYRDEPYWDVNAYRVGYGSDTITDPQTGQVRKVQPGDRIERSHAEADLSRRIPEFQATAARQVPAFAQLADNVKSGLTSVAYNYGSLPKSVVAAVNSGDVNAIASAVEALPANPDRRRQEAAVIRGGGSADAPAPGAQNAQFVIPGGSTLATNTSPDFTEDEVRDLRIMMRSERTRPLAQQILNERKALAAEGRKRQYELQDRAEQRSYDERIRRQGWSREDQIRAANQDREDKIRQGTWTREDEVRHKTWTHEAEVKADERKYQENAPTPDIKEYNLYVKQAQEAGETPESFTNWTRANKKSGATTIGNIGGQAIEPEFNKTTGKAIGERFDAISKEGDTARSDLAMVDQLRSLGGAINFKTMPALRGELAKYGVKIGDDVGEIQAYNSIIDKLTPAQRIPGAGASSDLDVKMFKSALPQLINTPEGNGLIMEVMQAMGEDKIARAVIAERAQTGEITPAQAINELRAMPSPLASYKERLEEAAKAAKETDSPAAPGKRVKIPQGYTGARVLSEAKETYARANEAQKALIRERVRSYGIDPKRLDN